MKKTSLSRVHVHDGIPQQFTTKPMTEKTTISLYCTKAIKASLSNYELLTCAGTALKTHAAKESVLLAENSYGVQLSHPRVPGGRCIALIRPTDTMNIVVVYGQSEFEESAATGEFSTELVQIVGLDDAGTIVQV